MGTKGPVRTQARGLGKAADPKHVAMRVHEGVLMSVLDLHATIRGGDPVLAAGASDLGLGFRNSGRRIAGRFGGFGGVEHEPRSAYRALDTVPAMGRSVVPQNPKPSLKVTRS